MNVLALIPARGGSKGVPRKNIKLLQGKPLIQYSIDACKGSKYISEIMVSTDDQEIAEVSKSLGASVPELRPAHLASDTSPTIDTVVYTLEYYQSKGNHFDAVILIQPTSPLRTSDDIDKAIEIFQSEGNDALISVIPVPHEYNPHWVFVRNDKGQPMIATGEKEIITRRQNLPPAYIRNGAIYITKSEVIINQKSLYGQSLSMYEMGDDLHVNIDTLEDWMNAEKIMEELNG